MNTTQNNQQVIEAKTVFGRVFGLETKNITTDAEARKYMDLTVQVVDEISTIVENAPKSGKVVEAMADLAQINREVYEYTTRNSGLEVQLAARIGKLVMEYTTHLGRFL